MKEQSPIPKMAEINVNSLGETSREGRKPNGYWNDALNVKRELLDFIQFEGVRVFPTQRLFREANKHGLLHGINKTGGRAFWECELGFVDNRPQVKNRMVRNGWTQDEVGTRLFQLAQEVGHFPSYSEMKESGLSKYAVVKTGGVKFWKDKIQLEGKQREKNFYSDEENIESEIRKLIEVHGFEDFPTVQMLKDVRASTLAKAMSRMGGIKTWRIRLGYTEGQKPKGYWEAAENIEKEMRDFIAENGLETFPNNELINERFPQLGSAMYRHYPGKSRALRSKLGFEALTSKPRGTWTPENIEAETRKIIGEHDLTKVPTYEWLTSHGFAGLADAMHTKYPGGKNALKEKLGINTGSTAIEPLLEAYEKALLDEPGLTFERFLQGA